MHKIVSGVTGSPYFLIVVVVMHSGVVSGLWIGVAAGVVERKE